MAGSEISVSAPEQTGYVVLARPIAAVAVGVLSVVAVGRFGFTSDLLVALFVIGILAVLSVIDIEQRRLPNVIVLPAASAILLAQLVLSPDRAWEWIAASLGAGLLFLVLALISPSGLGMGDVKLAMLIGAALGGSVVTALFVGTLAAAVYAIVLIVRNGADARRRSFPLGPFLAAGAVFALLAPSSLGL
jgi:leader peptidase (prepilin peptidase) / N-methyltransferase